MEQESLNRMCRRARAIGTLEGLALGACLLLEEIASEAADDYTEAYAGEAGRLAANIRSAIVELTDATKEPA